MAEDERRGAQACTGCGFPPFAGHAANCPAVQKEGEAASGFQVEEAVSDDDRKNFFEFFYRGYGFDPEHARKSAELSIKYINRSGSPLGAGAERRVFMIRDENQNIVAGAELFVGSKDGRMEAYLGHKMVDEKYRGQEVGALLIARRIQIAKERDCQEAYSLVERENGPALRSITKDGFVIKGNGMTKTGNQVSRDTYYVSRDLTREPEAARSLEEIESAMQVRTSAQLKGSKVLVSLANVDLVERAFDGGYVGLQIVMPKDTNLVSEPMIYMERVEKPSLRDEPLVA